MNLWVRSQDKENLIPIKNPICVYDNKIIYKESASYVITIGEYETKERAIEVLDEIHKCIVDKEVLDGCNNILTLANNKSLNEVNQILGRAEKIAVYEMPKD